MPKRKSIASIDAQIIACKNRIAKAKVRYDKLCDDLRMLQAERKLVMTQQILEAIKKSNRSYNELMNFLQAP